MNTCLIVAILAQGLGELRLGIDLVSCCEMGKLASYQPSSEELDEARRILQGLSPSQMRSRKGSLSYFLKEHEQDMDKYRGDTLQRKLEQFVAFQQQQAKIKKSVASEKKYTTRQDSHGELRVWTAEQMRKELGSVKAEALISSGKLKWQACSVTGSTEIELREFEVPQKWKEDVRGKSSSAIVSGQEDATGADILELEKAFEDNTEEGGKPKVKEEQLDPEQERVIAQQLENNEFLAGAGGALRLWQDFQTELQKVSTVASAERYIPADFVADVKKLMVRVGKYVKLLSQIVAENTITGRDVPLLKKTQSQLTEQYNDMMIIAQKFNLTATCSTKRRRKNPKAEAENPE